MDQRTFVFLRACASRLLVSVVLAFSTVHGAFAQAVDSGSITVGAILILTGMGAEQGINSQRGATLAQEEINQAGGINGKTLKLVYEDEVGPNPRGAVTAYHKLRALGGLRYILGPQWLNEVLAVDPLAVKDDVFLVIPSTCGSRLSDHTFCLWAKPDSETETYARYIFGKHQRLVAFGSSESWETETLEAFIRHYTALGGTILRRISPDQSATDVKAEAVLTKNENPDAIFSTAAIHFAQYRQELTRLRVQVPYYTVELFQELINAAGPAAEGVFNITPMLPDESFTKKFTARFNASPDVPATQAYDAIHMLAAALRKNGESFPEVQRFFRDFGEYTGAVGTIRSENGKVIIPLGIYQVKNGKQVLLEVR